MNANQPQRVYSDNPQQMLWPVSPFQGQAPPPLQLVGFSSPYQVGYQPTAQNQSAVNYQPGYSGNLQQRSLPATRFCMGCLDCAARQHACIQQPKSFDEAMD